MLATRACNPQIDVILGSETPNSDPRAIAGLDLWGGVVANYVVNQVYNNNFREAFFFIAVT